jgi:predicted AlkP superfamily pyrophosphatase or phosphodiesterase
MKKFLTLVLLLILGISSVYSQSEKNTNNVIIVVIDGARYSETFGAKAKYIPYMYNDLKQLGTVYTNFRISDEGQTKTCPGHSSMLTGTWQQIANDGSERPTKPTLFEYFRKEKGTPVTESFMIAGKSKLEALSYSTDNKYGENYRASVDCVDTTDDEVYNNLIKIMDKYHPRLTMVNFPDVDLRGHANDWNGYLRAITNADSLVYLLWEKIQRDPFYKNKTTLFVTDDHGRHTTDFTSHGDHCDGCEHIMLLALGKGFTKNRVVSRIHYQYDLCATTGELMGFKTPEAIGKSLLKK